MTGTNRDASTIDFDKVVESYNGRLHTVLRRFHTGPAALESWVHAEDPTESLVSMLESARAFGLPAVTVVVTASAGMIDVVRLGVLTAGLGAVAVSREGQALRATIVFAGPVRAGSPASVAQGAGPTRRAASRGPRSIDGIAVACLDESSLQAALEPFIRRTHEGRMPPGAGTSLESERGLVRLQVRVRGATITCARHRGASGTDRGTLEALCRLIEGQPLREALDHSVKRLEQSLRAVPFKPVVPGIQHGELIHPSLARASALMRDLEPQYRAACGPLSTESRWDPPPSSNWQQLNQGERLSRAQSILDVLLPRLGFPIGTLVAKSITRDTCLTLGFVGSPSQEQKRQLLSRAEQALKRSLEPTLTLYAEEASDGSPIRRL